MDVRLKDPDAIVDFGFNWGADYLIGAETLTSSAWTVDPVETGGIAIESDSNTTTTATVWTSGGKLRGIYTLTNRIVTSDGRTDERSITVRVEHR